MDGTGTRTAGEWPPRWVPIMLGAAALWLVPWAATLALMLPSHELSRNWNIAWTGFDLGLAALLGATAFAVWKRRSWLPEVAVATAALLLADAWFDLATAGDRDQLLWAVGLAFGAEIPFAILCFWTARSALRAPYARKTNG